MATRRGSSWAELDRRRSHSEKKTSKARKASWVERKSLWEAAVTDGTGAERMFMTLVDDLEHRVSKNAAGVLSGLDKCLRCALRLKTSAEKRNPLLNHLFQSLLPQLVGFVYMNEPLCHWYESAELLNTDHMVLKCLVLAQDLCSESLRYLVKPRATSRFINAVALLRVVTMGVDKTTYFHRTHKHRSVAEKEFSPYGAHHFTRCVAGDDGTKCLVCGKAGARTKYRWIAWLLENFGQANWTNFEFLSQILENPRNVRALPMEATEAILGFAAKIVEFLDPDLAKNFLPGALAVMELLVRRDVPGARPTDRFISVTFMLDKHLDAIFGCLLKPEAQTWLMKYARSCRYRELLGYKPLKLCCASDFRMAKDGIGIFLWNPEVTFSELRTQELANWHNLCLLLRSGHTNFIIQAPLPFRLCILSDLEDLYRQKLDTGPISSTD
ncbi:hypothetical protein AXG93_4492s1040 [Marchantia polymorpha subsp. ruderalis]|uniref:Uncharacterized protein n=1 Tax=Marchantia polymorpha subsp. ruderalis TaxID=1480154 RepID=A0A176W5B0_MARPO|nr:hypothetical protein AXG93_4492s1040 [Marchantia polymorpha subsp. ruderalis]